MPYQESDIPQFDVVFGRSLPAEVANFVARPMLVVTMADLWPHFRSDFPTDAAVYGVGSMERDVLERDLAVTEGKAAIVGLGGGRAIDCAKYFAWRSRLPLFQFPTSLSVDAVFGHRSAVRENGLVRYLGWAVPESIFIDYSVLESAPAEINRAGIGDVFCFFTGVMDWRYAHEIGRCEARWPYDESLARISLAKAEAALAGIEDIRDLTPVGVRLMVDALRWGGASYHGAGWCPRHVEGVEHFLFYALEAITGKSFLHGQAVCLGVIAGCMMHGQRLDEMTAAIRTAGVDVRPHSMGIGWDDVDAALRGLADFVRKEGLTYGIAHDFDVSDGFLADLRDRVEGSFPG